VRIAGGSQMTDCYSYEDCKRARLRVPAAAAIRECARHGRVAWRSVGGNHLVIELPRTVGKGCDKRRVQAGRDGLFCSTDILDALGY
jgi:hypothetical protein